MKKILLAFLGAALIGSAAFAEPDSGSFLANGSAFSVGNFYVEGNAGFVFPFGMLQENYDTSAKQPGAVFGAGLGYNHGCWLFGMVTSGVILKTMQVIPGQMQEVTHLHLLSAGYFQTKAFLSSHQFLKLYQELQ